MKPFHNHTTDHGTTTAPEEDKVVSRHVTSEGVLVYLRTASGQVQARLLRWTGDGEDVVTGGRGRLGGHTGRPRLRAC